MMTWLAWLVIVLALLVIVLNLWMMWQRVSDAARSPAEPSSTLAEHATKHRSEAEHVPPTVLEQLDERGYLSSRKLQMGCEAAICRTPFGARIVSGKYGLQEPQYAWDYASVAQAQKALASAKFRTDSEEGILVVGDEFSSSFYPATEPHNYSRRWKYTTDGQMRRF